MSLAATLVLVIFVVTILVIVSEKVSATAVALFAMSLAAGVLFLDGRMEFSEFVVLIEWDTILFVAAMMIVVSIAGSSGMFQYIALLLVRSTQGDAKRVFVTFMAFVFVLSLFFDPLPAMLVMGAFTVEVCRAVDMDYRPFLISEVIVANFASIPSVVGSVPNLVIAVGTELDFGLMFLSLLPFSLILFAVTIPLLLRYYRDRLVLPDEYDANILFMIRPEVMIKSRRDFYLSAVGMAILLLGFVFGPSALIEPSFVALLVASGMLLFSHERARDLLQKLSWDTVFFLIGLFGLVQALSVTGVIDLFVDNTTLLVGGNPFLGILIMIWIPGLALSIIDNIPVATILTPLALNLGVQNKMVPLSLIISSNIGGYVIPFGDAPNMIAMNLAEEAGNPISFLEFTKIAFPIGILHLIIATIYSYIGALLLI
ncbi:MAG: SLC13 family permease [Candidatus Thorarchaeota archaeon]